MQSGVWPIAGSLLMAVVILGRVVALIARWFKTNAERTERNRRIAEQDAARARRMEARTTAITDRSDPSA